MNPIARARLAKQGKQMRQAPPGRLSVSDTNVALAGSIRPNDTVYRRYYGAWRALRVVRTERYDRPGSIDGARIILTVQGDESSAPFPLPPMDEDALVKVAI